jgi:hypothetical protein
VPVPSEMTIMAISEGRPCPDMTRRPTRHRTIQRAVLATGNARCSRTWAVVGQSDASELAASSAPAMGGVAATEFRQVALRPAWAATPSVAVRSTRPPSWRAAPPW